MEYFLMAEIAIGFFALFGLAIWFIAKVGRHE